MTVTEGENKVFRKFEISDFREKSIDVFFYCDFLKSCHMR